MNKKIYNSIMCMLLFFVTMLNLLSCSVGEVTEQTPENVPITNIDADYKIVDTDEGCVIVFDDISKYEYNFDPDKYQFSVMEPRIKFNNLKEMKDTVTKGNLSEEQKRVIAGFPGVRFLRNDKNEVICCDFDNLKSPLIPSDLSIFCVQWEGEYYSFELKQKYNDDFDGFFSFVSEETYNRFVAEIKTFTDNDLIEVQKTEQLEGDKTAIYYTTSTAEYLRIVYTATDKNKTMNVVISYQLKSYRDRFKAETSASVPRDVKIYGTDGENYYVVNLDDFKSKPSYDWISKFDILDYQG